MTEREPSSLPEITSWKMTAEFYPEPVPFATYLDYPLKRISDFLNKPLPLSSL